MQAVPALATGSRTGCGRYPITHRDGTTDDGHLLARLGAHLFDHPNQLMSGNDGKLQFHMAGEHVLVRAADAGAFHLQQDFILANCGLWEFAQFDRARFGHDGGVNGAHGGLL